MYNIYIFIYACNNKKAAMNLKENKDSLEEGSWRCNFIIIYKKNTSIQANLACDKEIKLSYYYTDFLGHTPRFPVV